MSNQPLTMELEKTDYKALEKHLAEGLAKAKEALAESEAMLEKVKLIRKRLETADGKLENLMSEKSHTREERLRFLELLKELLDKGELAKLSKAVQSGPSSPHVVGAKEEGNQHVIYQ